MRYIAHSELDTGYSPVKQAAQKWSWCSGTVERRPSIDKYPSESTSRNFLISSTFFSDAMSSSFVGMSMP